MIHSARIAQEAAMANVDPADRPVYWGMTFSQILMILPLCKGFEGVFERNKEGKFEQVKKIFFVAEGCGPYYDDPYAFFLFFALKF